MADHQGVGEQLAQRLAADGGTAVIVRHGDVPAPVQSEVGYEIDLENPDHHRQVLGLLSDAGAVTRVVHTCALDGEFTGTEPVAVLERDQRRHTQSVVHLVQAIAEAEWSAWPRLWLVTRHAQHVGDASGPTAPGQAPLWGLGRVLGHQELTGMWGGLVDLDTGPVDEQAGLLYDQIRDLDGEDQVAFRDGRRHVLRLAAVRDLPPPLPASVRRDGCYVVTGGLGALGMLVARFLVDAGATRLVLMSRTRLPERTTWHQLEVDHPQRAVVDRLRELERLGASVEVTAVDVADEQQMRDWISAYRFEARLPIRGVVHVAGLVQDELLLRMTDEAFSRVLRPKVQGGWLLHEVTREEPLDFFVLYSSTGSTIASPGQVNYAAANAFLDALAHHRREQGLPAVSIGWGPWSVGMVEDLKLEQFYASRGIELITPEAGDRIMARALGRTPAHLIAISVDWATARQTAPRAALPAMFAGLGTAGDGDGDALDPEAISLLTTLAEVSPAERAGLLAAHLRTLTTRVLQMDPSRLGDDDPLTTLGLDSMMAVELKQRIEGAVGVDISVLELLQGATVGELATRIAGSLTLTGIPSADAGRADAEPSPEADAATLEEIDRLLADVNDADIEELLGELERDTTLDGDGGAR